MHKTSHAIATGLTTLDDILDGGYASNRCHLIEGQPGAGKTTLALQFLIEGRRRGEKALYITLSESPEELHDVAATHGLSLEGIAIYELVPAEFSLDTTRAQSVLHSADLELGETVQLVQKAVQESNPARIVFDSLSEIRLLAGDPLRYRREVLALKNFFSQHDCTVLFLDDLTEPMSDVNLHSLAHGVVRLEHLAVDYGMERRRLRVHKMRGRAFRGGYHDFVIRRGGLGIFPRLVVNATRAANPPKIDAAPVGSGIAALDALTGGGLDRGTVTLLQGPAGSGKSSLAMQFLAAAIERGERALILSFDETLLNFTRRATGLGVPIARYMAQDRLVFRTVDPAELSPGEFAAIIDDHVADGVTAVAIDSLSGYQHAMPQEGYLLLQMHELFSHLNERGVLTFLTMGQSGIVGSMRSPIDISYLADTVLLLRFFEAEGMIRRAISVVKKRTGDHERAIRELLFDQHGIQIGPCLSNFDALLTGTPTRRASGDQPALLQARE